MTNLSRLLIPSGLFLAYLLHPNVAVAENSNLPTRLPEFPKSAEAAPSAEVTSLESEQVSSTPSQSTVPSQSTIPARQSFVSTGAPIAIDHLGISITPPPAWEVEANTGALSLVMREPRDEKPDYERPKYQRNITVATMHYSSPIDEKRAAELKEQLVKNFSQDASVSEFQVIEHKFFNYRGTNDGLLVFSSLKIGEYPMMQMHVLVSGAEKQFLLTYTDLAERFSSTSDRGFEQAWNTLVSIEVSGETPSRQNEYIRYGAVAGGILCFIAIGLLLRRKASKRDYNPEVDALESFADDIDQSPSLFATLAHGWRLDRQSAGDDGDNGDDMAFSNHARRVTRETEYVSNF